MAFPKNKSRKILVKEKIYYWLCTKEIIIDTPVGISPNTSHELPPLERDIDWYGYEDVYGYRSKSILLILDESARIKIRFEFDSLYYFNPTLKKTEVRFVPVTPGLVRKCIEYLNEQKLWINNNSIDSIRTYKLFGKEITTSLNF